MLLGICGYGFTGSGAVVGLLKEYEEPQVFSNAELQETFKVDGLQDLEYHLVKQYSRHISGDAAIKRFKEVRGFNRTPILKKTIPAREYIRISDEYINSIIQEEWYGVDNIDYSTKFPLYNFLVLVIKKVFFPFYEKATGQAYKHWPARKMYLCINPEDFYEKTKIYTDNLMKAMGADLSKDIVLDQVFEGNRPENSFLFFRDARAIVVDRDPRDVFLLAKHGKRSSAETRFMPRENVNVFVNYYKKIRPMHTDDSSGKVLRIRFEDLIYNYESTCRLIEEFTGYKNHKFPKKYFDPAISVYNTQLFHNPKYCHDMEDIRFIEKELKEYLYPFEQYKKLENFKQAF